MLYMTQTKCRIILQSCLQVTCRIPIIVIFSVTSLSKHKNNDAVAVTDTPSRHTKKCFQHWDAFQFGLLVERKVNEKAIVSLSIGSERKNKKNQKQISHFVCHHWAKGEPLMNYPNTRRGGRHNRSASKLESEREHTQSSGNGFFPLLSFFPSIHLVTKEIERKTGARRLWRRLSAWKLFDNNLFSLGCCILLGVSPLIFG